MGVSTRILHLHIDRLVVDGLPASSKASFVRALEGQLTTLAEAHAETVFTQPSHRIDRPLTQVMQPRATAEQAAAQVAGLISHSLSNNAKEGPRHG